ncbi:MAG: hypothetical protein Kow009_01290 [Spirochaetales bacterium]
MDRNSKGTLISIAAFLGIGLLYVVLSSYFSMPALRVEHHKTLWTLGATLESFVTHFIPLVGAGMILASSLWGRGESLPYPTSEALQQIRKLFFLALGIACFYGILQEGLLPWATQMKQSALRKTQLANELRDKALAAERAREYSNARFYLEYYLTMFPDDELQQDRLDRIRELEREQQIKQPPVPEQPPTILELRELSFQDLQEKAIRYFQKQDFVAAEYFALMALKLRPDHPGMLRLLASAQNALSRIQLTPEQKARKALYDAKHQGYTYLKRGDAIAAYYHFQELARQHPLDSEIAKYLRIAYEKVKEEAFFSDEISLVTGEPLASDVFFKNSFREGMEEFLYFSKIVSMGPNSYYVFDIEGVGIDSSGKVAYQFKAPFGKFLDGTLLMHCLDRSDPKRATRPTYIQGDPPSEPSTILRIKLGPQDLISLGRLIHSPLEAPFAMAVSHLKTFPLVGIEVMPVVHSLLMRLQKPFTCLNVFLLVLILGRLLRSKYYTRPPLAMYLLVPFLPVLFTVPLSLFEYELSVIVSILIDKAGLGFLTAGATLLGIEGILMLAILFYGVQAFTRERA